MGEKERTVERTRSGGEGGEHIMKKNREYGLESRPSGVGSERGRQEISYDRDQDGRAREMVAVSPTDQHEPFLFLLEEMRWNAAGSQ